MRKIVNM
jgi:replication factor C subunit 3/5